ncbi:MAG: hypothetical protein NT004_04950 [Bacteroidetes bacterium]|nr:hypothetical protein [Bacteroidota bacterium]
MRYPLFLLFGLAFIVSVPVNGQFVTLARKIKSKHTSQTDVATVMIDAGTFRVYGAVIDTLGSDPKFQITRRDNAERFVEFTRETYKVSIKVDSLAIEQSQITVTAVHSDNSPKQATDIAVDAIIKVCNKIGVKCTLDKP